LWEQTEKEALRATRANVDEVEGMRAVVGIVVATKIIANVKFGKELAGCCCHSFFVV
jgi:hypothetical protein